MIKVKFLTDEEGSIPTKEFNTPAAAFVYALEEAPNVFGRRKRGEEHCFHYLSGRSGENGVVLVAMSREDDRPSACDEDEQVPIGDGNEWMGIDKACRLNGSFDPQSLRRGLFTGRWDQLTEGVEYVLSNKKIRVAYPLIFDAIGGYSPRVIKELPADIVERYERAGSLGKLAKEIGVAPSTIRKRLRSLNIDTSRKPSVCR